MKKENHINLWRILLEGARTSHRFPGKQFPFDWGQLTNLKVLNLADNPLTEGPIPDSLPVGPGEPAVVRRTRETAGGGETAAPSQARQGEASPGYPLQRPGRGRLVGFDQLAERPTGGSVVRR